ncbi:MAG: acyl carrier protein [Chloroflexi bacterium]|nr:acyl carrier protein [Chloroflexota bacterium]
MMDTKALIRRFIADNLMYSSNGLQLDDDASFLEEGVIDSLGVMELVVFVEDQFGVQVADEEVTPEYFDSVNRLACYVESKLA